MGQFYHWFVSSTITWKAQALFTFLLWHCWGLSTWHLGLLPHAYRMAATAPGIASRYDNVLSHCPGEENPRNPQQSSPWASLAKTGMRSQVLDAAWGSRFLAFAAFSVAGGCAAKEEDALELLGRLRRGLLRDLVLCLPRTVLSTCYFYPLSSPPVITSPPHYPFTFVNCNLSQNWLLSQD